MFINVLGEEQYDQYQKEHNIHTYTNHKGQIQHKYIKIKQNKNGYKSIAVSATPYHEYY
jgi:hypothetical protein